MAYCGIGIRASSWPPEFTSASRNFVAQTFSKRRIAADEFGSSASPEVLDVLVGDQPGQLLDDRVEGATSVLAQILELDPGDVAVGVLDDEDEVDDADRPCLDELLERRRDLAAELIPGELHEQELYRPEIGHLFPSFGTRCGRAESLCGDSMPQAGATALSGPLCKARPMRIGVFIGDASGARTSVDELLAAARTAEARGFTTGWVPHIPWSLDGLTALALAGQVTRRIELGTAVMPTYPRHPLAMAQQALSTQAATNGRLALGIGPSHPVVIERMYGLEYQAPARHTREYVEVLRAAFACTGNVEYHGEFFDFSSMLDVPGRVACPDPRRRARAADAEAGRRGRRRDHHVLGERARTDEHIVPRITRAAEAAGRAARRVSSWACPSRSCDDRDAARERAARVFTAYQGIPTYQRVMARGGDAAPEDIAIIGPESEVRARLRAYADAGATDLCAAPLGLDADRDASYARTIDVLASMTPDL